MAENQGVTGKTRNCINLPVFMAAALFIVGSVLSAAPADAQLQLNTIKRAIQKNVQLAVTRQQLKLRIEQSAGPVRAIDINADGQYLATISDDLRPRIWDLKEGRQIDRLDSIGSANPAIQFTPDGQSVAFFDSSARLNIRDVASGDTRYIATNSTLPTSFSFSPDGTSIVIGDDGGAIHLVSITDSQQIRSFAGNGKPVSTVEIGSTGQFILAADVTGLVQIVETSSGAVVREFQATQGTLNDIHFGVDETEFFTADSDGRLVHWRVDSDSPVEVYKGAERGLVSLAFSVEGRSVAAVEDQKRLLIWDYGKPDEPRIVEAHPEGIVKVRFDSSPGRLVTTGAEGVTKFWNVDTGEHIVSLISTEHGWAVVDADGRFDGSSRALSNLAWVGDTVDLPIDNFTDQYYEPDLLQKKRLGIGTLLTAGSASLAEGILPPPVSEVDVPPTLKLDQLEPIEIKVTARGEGGGVTIVNLFHNTKLVSTGSITNREEDEDDGKQIVEVTYKIRPIAGRNIFHANAASSEAILGNTTQVVSNVTAPPHAPNLHVLTIGLNEYLDPELKLNYAIPDARGIQEAMKSAYSGLFAEIKFYELFNEKATRRGVTAALDKFKDTSPEDVVLIYYAGHGEASPDEFFFVTYEFELPLSVNRLERRALSATKIKEMIQDIGARRVILLIDACKSGTAVAGFEDQVDRRVLRQMGQSVGLHIVSATAKQQFAVELQDLGHGVFTYSLIQAMSGKADDEPRDGNLTVREVVRYSEDSVPDLSQKYAQYQHWPLAYSRGLDFTLSKTGQTQ
ncbi:MAG: caspase family protein [Alphaproteobacteria bacterium]